MRLKVGLESTLIFPELDVAASSSVRSNRSPISLPRSNSSSPAEVPWSQVARPRSDHRLNS